jgi:hypothetical protein
VRAFAAPHLGTAAVERDVRLAEGALEGAGAHHPRQQVAAGPVRGRPGGRIPGHRIAGCVLGAGIRGPGILGAPVQMGGAGHHGRGQIKRAKAGDDPPPRRRADRMQIRRADEVGDETGRRPAVDRLRRADLVNPVGARRLGGDPDKTLPDGWNRPDPRTGAPKRIDRGGASWGDRWGDRWGDGGSGRPSCAGGPAAGILEPDFQGRHPGRSLSDPGMKATATRPIRFGPVERWPGGTGDTSRGDGARQVAPRRRRTGRGDRRPRMRPPAARPAGLAQPV